MSLDVPLKKNVASLSLAFLTTGCPVSSPEGGGAPAAPPVKVKIEVGSGEAKQAPPPPPPEKNWVITPVKVKFDPPPLEQMNSGKALVVLKLSKSGERQEAKVCVKFLDADEAEIDSGEKKVTLDGGASETITVEDVVDKRKWPDIAAVKSYIVGPEDNFGNPDFAFVCGRGTGKAVSNTAFINVKTGEVK